MFAGMAVGVFSRVFWYPAPYLFPYSTKSLLGVLGVKPNSTLPFTQPRTHPPKPSKPICTCLVQRDWIFLPSSVDLVRSQVSGFDHQ